MDNYVGPYRILRLIKKGGQGSVYLGYDKRLHRKVAIKIYSLPAKRKERRRLLHEARLVASIQSPKVVQIHDVIESSNHLALIMEYVPGCSLEEFLAEERPSMASVLRIGTDVAGALALARQQHIVHGDVKAGNVLITDTGRAKLTDFGISRTTGKGPLGHLDMGSFSALSPEQLRGETLDERADMFALGCLLYRMLSGEQPFYRDGRLDPDLLLKHEPRPLEELVGGEVELPEQLLKIISRLLQKDRQKRTARTRRVRQVLRSVLHSLPLSASNSLLREARPYFRHESPEDLPLKIPSGLGQGGRSTLPPSGTWAARLWHRTKALRWPARTALLLTLLAVGVVPVVVARRDTVNPVRFEEPVIVVSPEVDLPHEVSPAWILREVKQTLATQLGTLRVIGPVAAPLRTTLYAGGAPKPWRESPKQVFQLALNCAGDLCVFAVSREQSGRRVHRQAVLMPDMPIEQWRDAVRAATLALYP